MNNICLLSNIQLNDSLHYRAFWMDITCAFLPMVKRGRVKHIRWRDRLTIFQRIKKESYQEQWNKCFRRLKSWKWLDGRLVTLQRIIYEHFFKNLKHLIFSFIFLIHLFVSFIRHYFVYKLITVNVFIGGEELN